MVNRDQGTAKVHQNQDFACVCVQVNIICYLDQSCYQCCGGPEAWFKRIKNIVRLEKDELFDCFISDRRKMCQLGV